MNEQTIMPAYPWFAKKEVNLKYLPKKIRVMQFLGVPYPAGYDTKAIDDYMKQAEGIVADLKASGINDVNPKSQMVAMIAYMHKLGRDISGGAITKEHTEEHKDLDEVIEIDEGATIYKNNCASCHGANGEGVAIFPSLVDDEWLYGDSPADVAKATSEGTSKGMPGFSDELSEEQIRQLTVYILDVLK